MQASVLDGFAFDPFSFQQDGLTAPEATGAFVQACAGLALRHPYRVEEPAEYPQGYREAGIPAPLGHRRIGSAVRGAASLRLRSACRSSRTCARGTLGRDGLDSDACAEIRARSPCCRSTLPHPLRLKSFHYILSRLTTEKTGAPAPGWHRREREGAVCVRERPGCRTGRSLQLCAGPCRSGRTRAKGGRAEPSLSEPLWSGAQARE